MRKFEELFFKTLMIIASIIIVGSFFLIVSTILIKGLPAFNMDLITKTPDGGFYMGKEGGILNAIIGSSVSSAFSATTSNKRPSDLPLCATVMAMRTAALSFVTFVQG